MGYFKNTFTTLTVPLLLRFLLFHSSEYTFYIFISNLYSLQPSVVLQPRKTVLWLQFQFHCIAVIQPSD